MTDNKQKTIELTKEGLAELHAELKDLVEVKTPQVVERVSIAREHGDLSENSEYQSARDDKDLVDARIAEIEKILEKAKVVKQTRGTQQVGIGSTIVIYTKGKANKKTTFQIVGEFEADPGERKISSDSPMGKAMIGKKKNEEVKVSAPAGDVVYVISKIK